MSSDFLVLYSKAFDPRRSHWLRYTCQGKSANKKVYFFLIIWGGGLGSLGSLPSLLKCLLMMVEESADYSYKMYYHILTRYCSVLLDP